MINQLRTLPAHLIVRHLAGPRSLLWAAWGWLLGEGDLDHKRRCLEEILRLEPDNERARRALAWVKQEQQEQTMHP